MQRAIPVLVVIAFVIGLVAAPSAHSAPFDTARVSGREEPNFGEIIQQQHETASSAPNQVASPAVPAVSLPSRGATAPSQGTVNSTANIRSGAGTNYPIVGKAKAGQRVDISGCNSACNWYRLANGTWIAAFLVDVTSGNVTQQANTQNTAKSSTLTQQQLDGLMPQERTIRPRLEPAVTLAIQPAEQNLPAPAPANDGNVQKNATQNLPPATAGNQTASPTGSSTVSNSPWVATGQSSLPADAHGNVQSSASSAPCSCSGQFYTCSSFTTQAKAQACYQYCLSQGWGDVHTLDRDYNGLACERLP